MNQLQDISTARHGNVFVTLNPTIEPNPETVISVHEAEHPMFTAEVSLKSLLWSLVPTPAYRIRHLIDRVGTTELTQYPKYERDHLCWGLDKAWCVACQLSSCSYHRQ